MQFHPNFGSLENSAEMERPADQGDNERCPDTADAIEKIEGSNQGFCV